MLFVDTLSLASDGHLYFTVNQVHLAAWIPLTRHARLKAGESVLVLGATGVVGQVAVQTAKILGAGHVVGAARDRVTIGAGAGDSAEVPFRSLMGRAHIRSSADDGHTRDCEQGFCCLSE